MKKFRNLFLMMLFATIAFVVSVGSVYAAAIKVGNQMIVCEDEKLEAGDKTKCYYIAKKQTGVQADDQLGGFVSVAYTSKNLEIVGDVKYSKLTNVTSEYLGSGEGVAGAGNKYTKADTANNIAAFTCNLSAYTLPSKIGSNKKDSGCIIVYSNSDTEGYFKGNGTGYSLKDYYAKSASGGTGSYLIMSIYEVRLDPATTNSECGDICIKAWTVPVGTYYSKYADGNCTSGGTGCGDAMEFKEICKELHYTGTPDDNPKNGAFVSYILLAAGAFIAICAVAISKKNNRLYKV